MRAITNTQCIFCDDLTGPHDDNSVIDKSGMVCGACVKSLGLTVFDFLPCVCCGWPSLDHTTESSDDGGLLCKQCSTTDSFWRKGAYL